MKVKELFEQQVGSLKFSSHPTMFRNETNLLLTAAFIKDEKLDVEIKKASFIKLQKYIESPNEAHLQKVLRHINKMDFGKVSSSMVNTTDDYFIELELKSSEDLKLLPKHCIVSVMGKSSALISLEGIHKIVSQIDGVMDFSQVAIKSNILGLLKIKGLKAAYLIDRDLQNIINKYLPNGDLFACQQELIDNNFDYMAKL